jgi:hypothetical protein
VQKINNVNVKRLLAEVLADHLEDCPFQNERVVDGHEADILYAIPARLATTGDACVHNIIGNEEICLHLEWTVNGASFFFGRGRETDPFNSPAKDSGLEVFCLGELATLENLDRVDDAQATVELSTGDVVVHALSGGKTMVPREENSVEGRTR